MKKNTFNTFEQNFKIKYPKLIRKLVGRKQN